MSQLEADLNDKAAYEIKKLEEAGIKLTPQDIVTINHLAWQVESPPVRMFLARGNPVSVGGQLLWPLTMKAESWIDMVDYAVPDRWKTFVRGFAMAHCYSDGGELDIPPENVCKAVKKWRRQLACTEDMLDEAILQVEDQEALPELPPDPESGKPMTLGEVSAFIAATNGGDPEFWETRCSSNYSIAVLSNIVKSRMAEGGSVRDDSAIRAERAFGWALEKIRLRGLETPDGP